MVGDAEQEIIHFVKEGTHSVRPSTVDVTSGCRKDGLAKDELLPLRHPNGFGEGDLRNQGMHREMKDGLAVKSVHFPHPLTDDSPGVQSLGGGTADTQITNDEERDRFKDTREVRGLYREISRIYGLDFWEELGRPESVHAPSFDHDTSGHSDDQALVIMDKEALDHRLLTKSFLNYLS
ncbi:uncharacterized protein LOC119731662 [Patiria miniata]|uniref:Uncharacterized protein n=1 Tax=Patiria miniata TaxID=46514 RepID=A0A914AAB1_PATMI|nr:uncharacterized protein LOC119731662 [Patiria miniata]